MDESVLVLRVLFIECLHGLRSAAATVQGAHYPCLWCIAP